MGEVELLTLDAVAQAERIRTGAISAIELIDAAIARIEALNPVINSVVIERFDCARAEARRVSRGSEAPFAGVPVLLKDLGQQIEGVRQTDGSRAVIEQPAASDSHLAAGYRRAGMIFLGKTSSPEFANHSTSEPVLYGPCRNPWDTSLTTGGSSGGSAAAVAARLVAVAGASDGAGSIRIPSSCCGTYGLKPTRGRISTAPEAGDTLFGLATVHAITRSVRDSAALLDISSGPVLGDPYWLPQAPRPFLEELDLDSGRLRIGVSTSHPVGAGVHPDCIAATEHTAELLAELGHEIEEAAPRFDVSALRTSMLDLWAAGNAAWHDALAAALGRRLESDELEPTTWELVEHARALSAADLTRALEHLEAAAWQIAGFFEDHDLWLTPTLAQPPLRLGELNRSVGSAAGWWSYDLEFNPWNAIANICGSPAASLPLYWNGGELPIGTMLTGRFADDAGVLRVSAALEQLDPWAARIPAI
ncbi:MAG: amidase [Solirubrobacterales bacterium]|nr:amidase [Solirubrobacterales bacterium]